MAIRADFERKAKCPDRSLDVELRKPGEYAPGPGWLPRLDARALMRLPSASLRSLGDMRIVGEVERARLDGAACPVGDACLPGDGEREDPEEIGLLVGLRAEAALSAGEDGAAGDLSVFAFLLPLLLAS